MKAACIQIITRIVWFNEETSKFRLDWDGWWSRNVWWPIERRWVTDERKQDTVGTTVFNWINRWNVGIMKWIEVNLPNHGQRPQLMKDTRKACFCVNDDMERTANIVLHLLCKTVTIFNNRSSIIVHDRIMRKSWLNSNTGNELARFRSSAAKKIFYVIWFSSNLNADHWAPKYPDGCWRSVWMTHSVRFVCRLQNAFRQMISHN